jgi:hypothetical protein
VHPELKRLYVYMLNTDTKYFFNDIRVIQEQYDWFTIHFLSKMKNGLNKYVTLVPNDQ